MTDNLKSVRIIHNIWEYCIVRTTECPKVYKTYLSNTPSNSVFGFIRRRRYNCAIRLESADKNSDNTVLYYKCTVVGAVL
jgi:hypothetical protein